MNYTFTPESVYNKRVVLPSSSDAVICNYLQNGTYTENAFDIKSKVLEIYDFSGENLITSNPDSEHILASKSSEKTFTFSVSDNYGVKKGGLKYVIKADVYKDKSIVKSKSIKSNPLEVDRKGTAGKARGPDRRFSLRFGIRKLFCFGHRQCLNQATQNA